MKIKKVDYLGLDHAKVAEQFEGNPVFINYFSIDGFNAPMAVYESKNPNREKGHKRYMMLFKQGGRWIVTGREEIRDQDRYRGAVYCSTCDELVYSAYRHDMNYCSCETFFMDGGEAYGRSNGPGECIDLLTDTIVERKEAAPDESDAAHSTEGEDDMC